MSQTQVRRMPWAALTDAVRARVGRGEPDAGGSLSVRDYVNVNGGQRTRMMGFDQPLVWVTVSLMLLGLVMVYSATIALPDSPRFANYTPTFFLQRHLISLMMAMSLGAVATQIPMASWERLARPLFIFSLVLLMLVLIPGIGKVVYGARRWLPLGIMNFQPSELAKLAIVQPQPEHEHLDANAALIAAAPWMLAVIKQLAHAIAHGDGYALDAAHSSAQLLIEHLED